MKRNIIDILEKYLAGKKINAIVHLGVGAGQDIPGYLQLNPERVVAVDGNSDACKALAKKFTEPEVEIIEAVIVSDDFSEDEVDFNIMVPRSFSGVLPPQGIKKRFPNLKVRKSKPAKPVCFKAFLHSLELKSNNGINVLVLQLNGLERFLFSSLEKETLDIFDYLAVDDDIHTLFGKSDDDVIWDFPSQARSQTFELLETHGGSVFDRRILKKDIQGLLVKEMVSLKNKFNKVCEENKALQTANDNIKELTQKEKQLLQAEKRKLISSISNLESVNENLEKSMTDLKAQLNQSNEALKKSTTEKDTALDRVKSLEQEQRELDYRQTILDSEIVKAEAQLELVKDVVLREKEF